MNNKPIAWLYSKIEPDQYGMSSIHYSPTKWGENESVHLYVETPLYDHPEKTLTDEKQFKADYIANFLSAYMAVRYDNDCANGHPLKGYQPIEDAQFLANEAWALLKKAG